MPDFRCDPFEPDLPPLQGELLHDEDPGSPHGKGYFLYGIALSLLFHGALLAWFMTQSVGSRSVVPEAVMQDLPPIQVRIVNRPPVPVLPPQPLPALPPAPTTGVVQLPPMPTPVPTPELVPAPREQPPQDSGVTTLRLPSTDNLRQAINQVGSGSADTLRLPDCHQLLRGGFLVNCEERDDVDFSQLERNATYEFLARRSAPYRPSEGTRRLLADAEQISENPQAAGMDSIALDSFLRGLREAATAHSVTSGTERSLDMIDLNDTGRQSIRRTMGQAPVTLSH